MTKQTVLPGDEEFMLALRAKPLSRSMLISLLSLSDSAFKVISKRLIDLGYIYKPKYGLYALTDEGKAYIQRHYLTMKPTFGSKEVQTLIQKIPTEPHQSLFRLFLSGYVARLKLFDERDEKGEYRYTDCWCGFLIGGRTTSHKTNTATLLCRVLNLTPEDKYIIGVATSLPKELWVRRIHRKGEERPTALPGLILSYPFVCLDDWRKGDPDVRRSVMRFLDGINRRTIEGVRVEIRPCPLITTNLNPISKELDISEDRVRRSVIVNTEGLGKTPREYEEAADDIFSGDIPIIETDNLRTPFHTLEPDERDLIREILYEGVGEDRKEAVFDSQSVTILVLGWLILTQGRNPKTAIFEVCYDKLVTLETLGLTVEGWRDLFLDRYGKYKGKIDPSFEKKRLEIEKRKEEIKIEIEKGEEKIEEIQKTKEETRKDLVRAYAKVNTDYKLLVKDLVKAKKLVPEIETGGLLDIIRDDKEQFGGGKKTQDRLERYQRAFNEDKKASLSYFTQAKQKEEEAIQGKIDKEAGKRAKGDERANLLWELKDWRYKINKTGEPYTPAIQRLREKSSRLSMDISFILKRPSRFSTAMLGEALRQAKAKAKPYLEQYQEDSKDLSEEMVNGVIGAGTDILTWVYEKAQGIGKKKPGGKGIGKPTKGKTLFERWLEGRKKKGGEPEKREYDGRPFDEF